VITSWNPGAERLYGYSPDEAIGQPISILIPPDRSGEERRILDQILGGGHVDHYETERVRKDGSVVSISLSVSPVRDPDGEISGASVIARDITDRRIAVERARGLQRITESLSRAVSTEPAAQLLMDEAVSALAADAASVALVDRTGEELELVASRGYSEEEMTGWTTFPLAAELPMSKAVRGQQPIWSSSPEDVKREFPDLASAEFRFDSLAVLPLTVEDHAFGAVAFSFRESREFSAEEKAFMIAATQQAANALERVKLHEAEREARDKLAFIARASEILGESLDLDETLDRLATVAVPEVSDWFAVDLAADEGLRSVAVAHVNPQKVDLARELRERYPPDPSAPSGLWNVIRTGRPELHGEIADQMLVEAAKDEEHLRILRELQMNSAMIVPLRAQGRTLGAVTFVAAESGRSYGTDDLSFAQELVSHAALAIDNASRYKREHETAITLQRALLPGVLPDLPGIELAARYLPAGAGVEAGGDWYDVIDLGGEDLMLVIGDVSGRGIPAASVMGSLRTAIRAYAVDRLRPAEIATRLGRLMDDLEGEQMVTAFMLMVNTRSGRGEYVRAGHLPGLVRDRDGAVRELMGTGSPPFGVLPDIPIVTEEVEISPGSTVLLYTDGLIERRGVPIDEGVEELKAILGRCPAAVEDCLEMILRELQPEPTDDDVALLGIRLGLSS
jgi:PAS domain S-box-containing protein